MLPQDEILSLNITYYPDITMCHLEALKQECSALTTRFMLPIPMSIGRVRLQSTNCRTCARAGVRLTLRTVQTSLHQVVRALLRRLNSDATLCCKHSEGFEMADFTGQQSKARQRCEVMAREGFSRRCVSRHNPDLRWLTTLSVYLDFGGTYVFIGRRMSSSCTLTRYYNTFWSALTWKFLDQGGHYSY